MIIITGIGRCGTSVMAKFLKECGLDIGSDRWFKPINAGLENKRTLSINQRLIRHYIKGEEIDLEEVKEDIDNLDYDAVKDPQFLTDHRIIRFWDDVRKDISVIWMTRDYKEIVKSMKKTPEWTTPVYRLFPDMMAKKEQQFKKALDQLEIPYQMIEYPIESFEVLDSVLDLPENAEKIWNEIYFI